MGETTHSSKPYVHTVKRAPSSTGNNHCKRFLVVPVWTLVEKWAILYSRPISYPESLSRVKSYMVRSQYSDLFVLVVHCTVTGNRWQDWLSHFNKNALSTVQNSTNNPIMKPDWLASSGVPRSFKLVDGSNIITGAVVPVEPTQTTLLVRDIPYQSNDSALVRNIRDGIIILSMSLLLLF